MVLGGPDGELAASLRYLNQRFAMPYAEVKGLLTDIGTRYLNQRFAMPYAEVKGLLTDIGTEELAHVEMISAILYQLTKDLSIDEIKASGFDTYFVDHTAGIYPVAASGAPFTATYFQSKGDIITDLHENMAAEQKARTTYDNILRLADDPDVRDPIRFLRQREIVHYQRFGETQNMVFLILNRIVQDNTKSCRQKNPHASFMIHEDSVLCRVKTAILD